MYPFFLPACYLTWFTYYAYTRVSTDYHLDKPDEEFKDRVRRGAVEGYIIQQIQRDLKKGVNVPEDLEKSYIRNICIRFVPEKEAVCEYHFSKHFEALVSAARDNRKPNFEL